MPDVVDLKARLNWFPAWSDVEPGCNCSWCVQPIIESQLPAIRALSEDGKREARLHADCFFHNALTLLRRSVWISAIKAFGPAENLALKKKARKGRKKERGRLKQELKNQ